MSTIADIFTNKIAKKLQDNPDLASSINASYVFNLEGDGGGQWTMDLTSSPGEVKEGAIDEPNLKVTMAASDFKELIDGSLNAQMAFMTGKLKIEGDMPLALKLQAILG